MSATIDADNDHVKGFRNNVAKAYVEGLAWVLRYYFQGCPSWTWYYPYHYAPFAADFVEIDKIDISFDKGKPSKPYEQLMGVLPAASNHALPDVFHPLMENEDSEIIDFYPTELYVLLLFDLFSCAFSALSRPTFHLYSLSGSGSRGRLML